MQPKTVLKRRELRVEDQQRLLQRCVFCIRPGMADTSVHLVSAEFLQN